MSKEHKLLKENSDKILECLYRSTVRTPPGLKTNHFKMLIPGLLNKAINFVFPDKEIRIIEAEGKSYDWIIYNKDNTEVKISTKSTINSDLFPRKFKNSSKMTKGKNVTVINNNTTLNVSNFDSLLIFVQDIKKQIYGFYLFSMKTVQQSIKKTREGLGFFPKKKSDSDYYEIDIEKIKVLKRKYPDVPDEELNKILYESIDGLYDKLLNYKINKS